MHRFDGAEQYFTRAVDFGYSFSIEETFEKWGRDEILGDYVRLIRMIRPDVIVAHEPDGRRAAASTTRPRRMLSREAFKAAGRSGAVSRAAARGPAAVAGEEVLLQRRASASRARRPPAAGGARLVRGRHVDVFDPLLGGPTPRSAPKRAACTSARAWRSCSRCRGGAAAARATSSPTTVLAGRQRQDETSLFDGIDTTPPGLAQYAGRAAPGARGRPRGDRRRRRRRAEGVRARRAGRRGAPRSLAGLTAVRALRAGSARWASTTPARYEIDLRLKTKEDEFQQRADARARPPRRSRSPTMASSWRDSRYACRRSSPIAGRTTCRSGACVRGLRRRRPLRARSDRPAGVFRCESPRDAFRPTPASPSRTEATALPDARRYEFDADAPFGAAVPPDAVPRATRARRRAATPSRSTLPVQYRYEGNIFSGEKRMELNVVPRVSAVQLTPDDRDRAASSGRGRRRGASGARACASR